mmetsp:Transcript_35656/g.113293  ORF Transcript_35656/g.113293 Transcript_35656/m.113293 type:complete len:245 (-) Transcript_35656:762-1496(-)
MALELPDVLTTFQQRLHDPVSDILVHARHEGGRAVHELVGLQHDLPQGRQQGARGRGDQDAREVAQHTPLEDVVHLRAGPVAACDDKGHQHLLVRHRRRLHGRLVAREDPQQHALLVGHGQVLGRREPLVELVAPGRPPVHVLQGSKQPWLLAQRHHQAADVPLLLVGRLLRAVLREPVQLLRGSGRHHLEDGDLRLPVLWRPVLSGEGVPLWHECGADELLEVDVMKVSPLGDPLRVTEWLLG